MIIKELVTKEGKSYKIGFKDRGGVIDCKILEKRLFGYRTLYLKTVLKGLVNDYKGIAWSTIFSYEQDRKDRKKLLENWD